MTKEEDGWTSVAFAQFNLCIMYKVTTGHASWSNKMTKRFYFSVLCCLNWSSSTCYCICTVQLGIMYKVTPARDMLLGAIQWQKGSSLAWQRGSLNLGSRLLELIFKYVLLFQQLPVRVHGVSLMLLNYNKTAVAIPLEGLDYYSLYWK